MTPDQHPSQGPCRHLRVRRKTTKAGGSYAVCWRCGLVLVARWAAATLVPFPLDAAQEPPT